MKKLFGFTIGIIFIEIALFIIVGKMIGVINTLLLVGLTSVLGILIARKQGVQSVRKIRNSLSEGVPPGVAIIEAFLTFLGGILLVSPGFFTDFIGCLLVIPFTRQMFKPIIYFWLKRKLKNGKVTIIHR